MLLCVQLGIWFFILVESFFLTNTHIAVYPAVVLVPPGTPNTCFLFQLTYYLPFANLVAYGIDEKKRTSTAKEVIYN